MDTFLTFNAILSFIFIFVVIFFVCSPLLMSGRWYLKKYNFARIDVILRSNINCSGEYKETFNFSEGDLYLSIRNRRAWVSTDGLSKELRTIAVDIKTMTNNNDFMSVIQTHNDIAGRGYTIFIQQRNPS